LIVFKGAISYTEAMNMPLDDLFFYLEKGVKLHEETGGM